MASGGWKLDAGSSKLAANREKASCETVKPPLPNEINSLNRKISQSHSFCEVCEIVEQNRIGLRRD
jgi:hypothetical protein